MNYFNFSVLAFAIFCFACWIGNWHENTELRTRLEKNEAVIGQMQAEHELALSAANEALHARKEIQEYERQRICEAEAALGRNPDYCSQPVPDDLRLLWQNDSSEASGIPAASGTASGH